MMSGGSIFFRVRDGEGCCALIFFISARAAHPAVAALLDGADGAVSARGAARSRSRARGAPQPAAPSAQQGRADGAAGALMGRQERAASERQNFIFAKQK